MISSFFLPNPRRGYPRFKNRAQNYNFFMINASKKRFFSYFFSFFYTPKRTKTACKSTEKHKKKPARNAGVIAIGPSPRQGRDSSMRKFSSSSSIC